MDNDKINFSQLSPIRQKAFKELQKEFENTQNNIFSADTEQNISLFTGTKEEWENNGILNKLEGKGISSDALFTFLDADEDGILTKDEVSLVSSANESQNTSAAQIQPLSNQTQLNEAVDEAAVNELYALTSKYTDRTDLTQEEYGQIIALNQLENNFNNLYSQFGSQKDSEGWIDNVYNELKKLTNLGITREMVEDEFNSYRNMTDSLTAIINDDIETAQDLIMPQLTNQLSKAETADECMDILINFCGSEEKAMTIVNNWLSENIHDMQNCYISKDENNEYIINYVYENDYSANVELSSMFNTPLSILNFENIIADTKNIKDFAPKDFDSAYKFYTLTDYNIENIENCINESYIYSQANTGMSISYQLEQKLSDATPEDAFNTFKEMCNNDEDAAIEAFNNYYAAFFEENNQDIITNINSVSAKKNQNGEIEFILNIPSRYEFEESEIIYNPTELQALDNKIFSRNYDDEDYMKWQQINYNLQKINLNFTQLNYDIAKNEIIQKRYKTSFENSTGKTIEQAFTDYNNAYKNAYGQSELQETLSSYINDMDSYAAKLSAFTSIGFIGASFFCPVLGLGALGSSFIDNTIDGINMATNKTKNENWQGLVNDSLKEAAFIAIGMGIGKFANSTNELLKLQLLNNTNLSYKTITALGIGAEVTVDAGLGMGFDYLTTGDTNLSGNGLSVALDILSGIRGYKALAANGKANYYKDGNILISHSKDGVVRYAPQSEGIYKATVYDANERAKILSTDTVIKLNNGEFLSVKESKSNFELLCTYKLSQLDKQTYERALELTDKGIPISRAADTAVLTGEEALRADKLIAEGIVSPYYIWQIASLDSDNYEKAMRLIKEEHFSAPSAIDAASKTGADFDEAVAEIKSGEKKMKTELTREIEEQLELQANLLYSTSLPHILEAKNTTNELTDENTAELTARAKGVNSTLSKLIRKYESGDIKINDAASFIELSAMCKAAIGDSYGTRIQINSLTQDQAYEIINKNLKGMDMTAEQFIEYIKTDTYPNKDFKATKEYILGVLKQAQTQSVVDNLKKEIEKGLEITELNNYGNEISSYFTISQLCDIAKVYHEKTGKKLTIITQITDINSLGKVLNSGDHKFETDTAIFKTKNAVKDSGYTSSQMNIIYKFFNGYTGNGELQIRGTQVNAFGDVEHVPYDIRQGKITAKNKEYSSIYSVIKNMSDESYNQYNKYLTDTYDYLRLKELGIEITKPELSGTFTTKTGSIIPQDELNLLTMEGLTALNAKIHKK